VLRLGVAYPGGPEDPSLWSGVPAGLLRGLKEAGAEPVPLDASPGRALETGARLALSPLYPPDLWRHPGRSLLLAELGPEMVQLRSYGLARSLRRAPSVDLVLVINGLCIPPPRIPMITYEDMTAPLACRLGYPLWQALPRRALRGRMAIQAGLYRRAEACCVVTHFVARSLEDDYEVASEKVHIVGIGRNHEPPHRQRNWSVPRFLFVGRDWDRKRGDAVIRAFARVREQLPEARLDVVGGHPPLRAEGVVGHGPLEGEAVAELFATATCFVMPSTVEPSGIAYIEAASAGIPSIGTTVGGAREVIGEGGRVVDPDDQSLERAMCELADPELARRLGRAAREHSKRFSWRATGERMLAAVREALPRGVLPGGPPDAVSF
jgi:glycosyltransferase involved in cell wall biosynthesis